MNPPDAVAQSQAAGCASARRFLLRDRRQLRKVEQLLSVNRELPRHGPLKLSASPNREGAVFSAAAIPIEDSSVGNIELLVVGSAEFCASRVHAPG